MIAALEHDTRKRHEHRTMFLKKTNNTARGGADEMRAHPDTVLYDLLREKKPVSDTAFRELYSRHSHRIYAYCRSVFGDEDQAKDIFQEAFTRFYESAQTGKSVQNVPAYLLIITRNLCLTTKRRNATTVSFDEYQFPQHDRPHEKTELLELVTMAMQLLPDDHREALFLRDFEDLPYEQIADILSTNAVNARVRVLRARRKIREILQPYLVESPNDNTVRDLP
jgi:RNA polymerase sigma-70 factor, ECF subfamily